MRREMMRRLYEREKKSIHDSLEIPISLPPLHATTTRKKVVYQPSPQLPLNSIPSPPPLQTTKLEFCCFRGRRERG